MPKPHGITGVLMVVFAMAALGQETAVYHPADLQPPTVDDWYYLALRKQMKGTSTDCDPKAGWLPEEIWYYPCPPDLPCGAPVHPSYRGTYGIFHPGPYYIQSPRRVLLLPGHGDWPGDPPVDTGNQYMPVTKRGNQDSPSAPKAPNAPAPDKPTAPTKAAAASIVKKD